jgi:hypothetical protein
MLSGLFLAAMSIDRLLAVRFPMAATRLCTTKRAKITVTLITIPIVAINVHTFFVFEYIEDIKAGESVVAPCRAFFFRNVSTAFDRPVHV